MITCKSGKGLAAKLRDLTQPDTRKKQFQVRGRLTREINLPDQKNITAANYSTCRLVVLKLPAFTFLHFKGNNRNKGARRLADIKTLQQSSCVYSSHWHLLDGY